MKNNKGFTLIELLVVIAVIGILAAVIIASVGSARTKAKTNALKVEARQLFALAQSHYAETGSYYPSFYTTFSWTGVPADCDARFATTAYKDNAVAICKSMMEKLPTPTSGENHSKYKLLFGCGGSCNTQNQFSVQLRLEDGTTIAGSDWYCIGSSGAVYTAGPYSTTAPGCTYNP